MKNLLEAYQKVYQFQFDEALDPEERALRRAEIADKKASRMDPKVAKKYADSEGKSAERENKKSKGKHIHGMADSYEIDGGLVDEAKDDSYLETDMKKRQKNNEKAIEGMKKTKAHADMVKAARKHFEEVQTEESYMDYAKRKSAEKKDSRMTVTAADRKANTLAWQKYKKGNPAYKAADHVNEALDSTETKEKERIVTGMKKSASDFKKRYGDKWKEVMYATATKKAKDSMNTGKSDRRYGVEEEWKTVSKKAIDKLGGVANSGDMLNQARYTHKKGEKPPGSTTLRKRLEAQAKEAGLPPHRGQKGGMKREYSAATADAMLGNKGGPAAAAIKAGDQKDTPHVQYYLDYMKGKKK
jgi:hypothetical protein